METSQAATLSHPVPSRDPKRTAVGQQRGRRGASRPGPAPPALLQARAGGLRVQGLPPAPRRNGSALRGSPPAAAWLGFLNCACTIISQHLEAGKLLFERAHGPGNKSKPTGGGRILQPGAPEAALPMGFSPKPGQGPVVAQRPSPALQRAKLLLVGWRCSSWGTGASRRPLGLPCRTGHICLALAQQLSPGSGEPSPLTPLPVLPAAATRGRPEHQAGPPAGPSWRPPPWTRA